MMPETARDAGRYDRRDGVCLLTLGMLVAWLFRDALLGVGVFYKRDIHLVWVPQVEAFVRALWAGSWPVWDTSLSFGQPLLADPSAQVLYPPTWLNLVLRPWTYYTAFAFGHVLLSSAGLYLLARRWRLSWAASLVAAAIWTFSGPFLSLVDLWHHFAGAAWMPIVLAAADAALEDPRWPRTVRFALALTAQILAGSADMCVLTGLLIASLFVTRYLDWRPGAGRANRARTASAGAAVLLALGLTAPLWMTALDVVRRAARLSLPTSVRTYWSVHPLGLLEMLVPGLWSTLPLGPGLRDALFESREPFLQSIYLGLPALALVAAGLALSDHPRVKPLALVGGPALLLALGRHTPFYDLATLVLPPLRILRYPVKVTVLVALVWALLAGMGFEAWRARSPWPRRRALLVVAPLLAAAIVPLATALLFRLQPDRVGETLLKPLPDRASTVAVLAGAAGRLSTGGALGLAALALAIARLRSRGTAAGLASIAALLAVGDLCAYHRRPNPVAPTALYTHRPEVLGALGEPGAARIYVYDYSVPGKSKRYLGRPGAYALFRQPAGWSADASSALAMQMYLTPQAAGRWGLSQSYDVDYRGLYPTPLDQLTRLLPEAEGTPTHGKLLRMGGVTRVLALHREGFEDLSLVRTVEGLFREPIRVYAVPDPLPRAYAVEGVRAVEGSEAVKIVLDPAFDPAREVIVAEGVPAEAPRAPDGAGLGAVRILEHRPDRVRLEAELARPGYVVLLDAFDPGWRARVDGQPAPVLRANVIFRAVRVGEGRHTIEYVYRPRSLFAGLVASVAALLVMLVVAVLRARRSGPETGPRAASGEAS
jgi:hypothetical protein